jgi:hypothetical protein
MNRAQSEIHRSTPAQGSARIGSLKRTMPVWIRWMLPPSLAPVALTPFVARPLNPDRAVPVGIRRFLTTVSVTDDQSPRRPPGGLIGDCCGASHGRHQCCGYESISDHGAKFPVFRSIPIFARNQTWQQRRRSRLELAFKSGTDDRIEVLAERIMVGDAAYDQMGAFASIVAGN